MTHTAPPGRVALTDLFAPERMEHAFRRRGGRDVTAWQADARAALRGLLGLDRMDRELAGHRVTVGSLTTEQLDGYRRTRAVLRSEPAVDVPFWILKPDGSGPFPLAVLPHGHTDRGADQYVGLYRTPAEQRKIVVKHKDIAVQAVRRGFLCVVPATRGFAPVRVPDDGCRHASPCICQMTRCMLAGRTALGERLWDLTHLLDWAVARPDVDHTRTLAAGHSGGGVLSTFLAALDVRISVALANESVCPFVTDDGRVLWCDCNTIPGLLRWGQAGDLIGLVAPRPMLAVNGRTGLYPVDEVERTVRHAREVYEAVGRPDRLVFAVGAAGCLFYEDPGWNLVRAALPGLRQVPARRPAAPPGTDAEAADGPRPGRNAVVSLRPIDATNVVAVTRLDVHPHQRQFLPSNAFTIGQALVRPYTWLRAIYGGDQPVGVVAVVPDKPAPGSYYLWRFMIDKDHQANGFGIRALRLVLREFAARPAAEVMYLKYLPEPGGARSFYHRAGFEDTGEGDGPDGLMRIALPAVRDLGVAEATC